MIQVIEMGGLPVLVIFIFAAAAGPLILLGALIRYEVHRSQRRQVLEVLEAVEAGKIEEASRQCQEHTTYPYLHTLGALIEDYRTGHKPALTFIRAREISVQQLRPLSALDRGMLVALAAITIVPLVVALFGWIGKPSPTDILPQQQLATGSGVINIVSTPEVIREISSGLIVGSSGLVVFLPLLIGAVIAFSILLMEASRQRYLCLQWYTIELMDRLYKTENTCRDQREMLERTYADQWNWAAFFGGGLWYLIKGRVRLGLLLLGIQVVTSLIFLGFLVNIYCGVKGNSHLMAARRKAGKSLF